ncbi:glycosyltransferase family 4 protein [Paenibacillus sp. BC26]|uniref:glycosyltransferase family 4 protein n=1 Tax=Paenibacillus sp. BC26 TaxID=1881032 RepID=UPI0008DEBD5D|nr:glycosyltransferase family 4 protein [Paenibacillus sp. BC26]SFT02982.1 Glycosyltransferase involved in cell wall bisynthesis [Paenibacillus sp. BC26]
MNKRIFLFGFLNYPRGSAAANYTQYLSNALKEAQYDVYLITNINEEFKLQEQEGFMSYNAIKIIPFHISKRRILRRLEFEYGKGRILVNILKKHNLTSEDIVLLYSPDLYVHREVLKYKEQVGFKTACVATEWFPTSAFKSRREGKAYHTYFDQFLPRHDLLFPISSYIQNHLIEKNCNTMRLPIMADVHEHPIGTKSFDKIKFIFPGNGLMKDAIEVILKSFCKLAPNDKKRVELHLCGVKEEQIESLLTSQEYENLKEILVIHKWMQYKELIALYQAMHFLVLAREENQMTLANFPSKVPEVMCYGVIPIVSRVGDYTKYYLEDNVNALIFDGCEIDLCFEQICKALSMTQDEILELSAKARECVENKFDYRNWVGKIHHALVNM